MGGTIFFIGLVAFFLVVIPVTFILYNYVIKPNKSLKDGLKDWVDESADDF